MYKNTKQRDFFVFLSLIIGTNANNTQELNFAVFDLLENFSSQCEILKLFVTCCYPRDARNSKNTISYKKYKD